ncbi:MAG: hypothetical protein RLZ95_1253, partial [Bacteroidota bacterium]
IGQKWTVVQSQDRMLKSSINAVTAFNNFMGICVGDNGIIISYDVSRGYMAAKYEFSGVNYSLTCLSFPTSNIGYVGGVQSGTLLKTINGGKSWFEIQTVKYFTPKSVYFTSPEHGIVVSHLGDCIITDDGGKTWNNIKIDVNYRFNKVYFINDKKGYIVGTQHIKDERDYYSKVLILVSEDGGYSWQSAVKENNITKYDFIENNNYSRFTFVKYPYSKDDYHGELSDIYFKNELEGAAVGTKCFMSTTDGGISWIYNSVDQGVNDYSGITFTENGDFVAVGKSVDQAILAKAKIQEGKWDGSVKIDFAGFKGVVPAFMDDVVVVGKEGTLGYLTKNLTTLYSWKKMRENDPYLFSNYLYSIKFIDSTIGYAIGTFKDQSKFHTVFYKTIDAGLNWTANSNDNAISMRNIAFSDKLAIAAGFEGELPVAILYNDKNNAKSLNSESFDNFDLPDSLLDKDFWDITYFDKRNKWYTIGSNGIFMTLSEKDSDWKIKRIDTDETLTNIHITPSGNIFISSNNGLLYKSTDDGETFTKCATNTKVKLRGIHFTDDKKGFVVGDKGTLLKTNDGGITWKLIDVGLFKTESFLSSVCFKNDKVGFIVGENGSIFKTTNGGENWYTESSHTNEWLNKVYFFNDKNGYIVGDNGTILKYTEK